MRTQPEPQGRSQLGGRPRFAEDERWPRYSGFGLFTCQLDLAELPQGASDLFGLPEQGLLRLFTPDPNDVDEIFYWGSDGYVQALFTERDTAPAEWPDELPEPSRNAPLGLTFDLA